MPIKIPNLLPAYETLTRENIFVMTETRAITQDIRPLEILLLNLMPTKIDTETQIARILGNTTLQINLNLITTQSYAPRHTPHTHMETFYRVFDDICAQNYDGMIITGAPVENLPYEEVQYWSELCTIMEWSKTHVHSTLHICWGAQAGLYYHYGIPKYDLPKKLFGVYPHYVERKNHMLFRGFDDVFQVPHSRRTTVRRADLEKNPEIKILASGDVVGVFAAATENGHQVFVTGHSEYDADTLGNEYRRDIEKGVPIDPPVNYFPNDDPSKPPVVTWRSCGHLMFSNWLNYFVYQTTPYDLAEVSKGRSIHC